MRVRRFLSASLASLGIMLAASLSACGAAGQGLPAPGSPAPVAAPASSDAVATSAETPSGAAPAQQDAYEPTSWDASAYPEYYRVAGPAVVDGASSPDGAAAAQTAMSDPGLPKPGEVRYSRLDDLSRTQGVVAVVDHAMYEAARGHEAHFDKSDDPSGWGHNAKATIKAPNGHSYHGYFWNRSHLLADSLGGAAARDNVITGTRMQNVGANDGSGGMAYEESRVRDWLDAHPDGTVYYAATPAYVGDELVPRSVFVDVLTSDGQINDHVEVYNAAAGYDIDYATGEFSPAGE